ncbi:hypothetical protein [Paenibacillus sp. MBLB4367]|uniref:hypothetical protein n=1 Tax=Paenibacillus sp. MBLB4367 TaxID=3384767 RepID=UPI003907FC7E
MRKPADLPGGRLAAAGSRTSALALDRCASRRTCREADWLWPGELSRCAKAGDDAPHSGFTEK